MQEKNYFYLAGFSSAGIYLLICLSFLIYINAPKPKKYDSSKTTVLELDLISTKSDTKSVAKKTPEKVEEIVKKSTSTSAKPKADFKSLFANVNTKSEKVVEKEVNTVTESLDPSRFKSKFQKIKKTDNTSVSKLLNDVKTSTNVPTNSSTSNGKQDEYFSKIKEILWKRWNPVLLEPGLVVKVLVMISKEGSFDYRIMKYSDNQRFDESLKEFLETQINEEFPRPNLNSNVDIIVNFKSEG